MTMSDHMSPTWEVPHAVEIVRRAQGRRGSRSTEDAAIWNIIDAASSVRNAWSMIGASHFVGSVSVPRGIIDLIKELYDRFGTTWVDILRLMQRMRKILESRRLVTGTPGGPVFPPLPTSGPGDEWFGGRLKCCADLTYPEPEPVLIAEDYFLGVQFLFSGLYSDTRPCECDCCYFMQFVSGFYETQAIPLLVSKVNRIPEPAEDCVVKDASGKVVGRTPVGERADEPGEFIECAPGRWDSPSQEHGMVGTLYQSCWWQNIDTPHMETGWWMWGRGVRFSLEFIGVVFDMCQNMRIEDIDCFQIEAEMLVPATSTAKGTWRPCYSPPPGNALRKGTRR